MSSSKREDGSGTGGGGRKPPGGQVLPSGESSKEKGTSKDRRRADDQDRDPFGDPGPATMRRRSQSPSHRRRTPSDRAGTPQPGTYEFNADMKAHMETFGDPKKKRAWDEAEDLLERASGITQVIENVGRVDDTNRSRRLLPPVSTERQFIPQHDPHDLSLMAGGPSGPPGRSGVRGPPFGNDENFVLVIEYLEYHEDEDTVVDHLCFVLERCFGNPYKRYTANEVYKHMMVLMKDGRLPSIQIKVPGRFELKEQKEMTGWLHHYHNLPVGQQCQNLLEKCFHNFASQVAYGDDGAVRRPHPAHDELDVYRTVKFFERYTNMYGHAAWPRELKDRIWALYRTEEVKQPEKDERKRKYSNFDIVKKLGDDRKKYHILDERAIAAFLWLKHRPKVSGEGKEEEKLALEETRYFFSKGTPIATYCAQDL